jgi:hypothetical protein
MEGREWESDFFFCLLPYNVKLAKMLIALVGKIAGLNGFDFKDIGK